MKTNKEILMKFVSTQGYKRNSPDKNRPVNVIPSNQITMQDVDFPVKGVDNLGNEMVMQPGEEYTFPGDYVVETPSMQQGGQRTFLNTASQFLPVYETYLDIKDIAKGIRQNDKEQLNRGVIGLAAPFSGKAVLNAVDYVSDKLIGVDATNKLAATRNDVLNMSTSDLQKLYIKYGPGGYDKWVADGKPDLNKKQKGGETNNDREMVEGIADILTQVKDPANRRRIAKNMVADFKRENVKYNLQDFLSMAKAQMKEGGELNDYNMEYMKDGGNVPTNPELWSRAKSAAKSKYDVYPSAYANGYAAKWYKERGGGWKKAQQGGVVEPVYVFDKNDPRLKAYKDSLNLYEQGVEPFVHFDDYTGKSPRKEYAKKNYIPGKEGKPVTREQILNEIDYINEELISQDRPALIKNANERIALLKKSLETGVYPANLIYPEQQINALVYKKPVVQVEYKKPNTIVKEELYDMNNKQIGSEEQKKIGGCMECGGSVYADGGAYNGYMVNPMEMFYQEGGDTNMKLSNSEVVELAKNLGSNGAIHLDEYNALSPVDKQRVSKSFERFTGYNLDKIPYNSNVKNHTDSVQFLSGYNRGAKMSKNYPVASKTVYEQGIDPVFGVYGQGRSSGYFDNAKYQEGGEAEQPQQMQQGPDIEAAIGEISSMIAQGENPEDIYDMLIESGVPEQYAQGYLSEAMSDLEEDDMEEEDVPMDDDEMEEFEEFIDEEEEDMYANDESEEETEMKRGGSIKIKPSRKGTFKAQATKMGMSVAEAADYILRHKDEFSPAMVKKANFAKNFAKELGGEIYNLEKFGNGGIPDRYRNLGFTRVGAKRRSTRPGKKWMVLAKKGDKYKVVHGGYKGMSDYTQHRNPKRRERFWNRMGGKNSAKATDPFSPLYWHKRFGTWQEGGMYTGTRMYKAQAGGTKTYDQWLNENMNRPDVFQNSQSPDYLSSLYQMEVPSTPFQTPAISRMTRTGGSGMGAMEILDPMVPNVDNPYDLTLPATPTTGIETDRLVAPPGWNAMNNTQGLSTSGTMVQEEPTNRSGFNWRRNAGDIMLSSLGVVNQLKMRKDYEKEYKERLRNIGNSDQRYDAYTPSNPFGNYTLNAGPGSNFALVTNTPMQDFGTRMAGARYGGTTSYKKGGEYYATDEEIQMILAMGGEIEFLD